MKLLSLLSLFLVSVFGTCTLAFHQQAASTSRRLQTATRTSTSPIASPITRSSSSSMLMMASAGPATIEKEQVKRSGGAGPAVLDRPAVENIRNPAKERNQEGGENWEVRIYNDGMNTREHVARALVQITSMTEMTAYQTMMTAHQNGIASVGMFCFEIAEMYNEGLRLQGIVCDIVPVDEETN